MGKVVLELPVGEPVAGIASLDGEIYVLRAAESDQVEVYDVVTYKVQRRITVPDFGWLIDMTSCELHLCVYIADRSAECMHKLDSQGAFTQWEIHDVPRGVSVNAAHNVLVTCYGVHAIKEFTSGGCLLRELALPDELTNPWHAIQTLTGTDEFFVCHGHLLDSVHRVCKLSADGRRIVHSHGAQRGSDVGQYNRPRRMAIDNDEFLFVADVINRRVKLLSPTFGHMGLAVCDDQLKGQPNRLSLDVQRRRLYVADNVWGECASGRVLVISV